MTPNDVKKLVDAIISIAKMDGSISADEQNLINQVKEDGTLYIKIFNEIRDKGRITEKDIHVLERAKTRILTNATNKAGTDAIITEEERQILLKILQVINNPEFS